MWPQIDTRVMGNKCGDTSKMKDIRVERYYMLGGGGGGGNYIETKFGIGLNVKNVVRIDCGFLVSFRILTGFR